MLGEPILIGRDAARRAFRVARPLSRIAACRSAPARFDGQRDRVLLSRLAVRHRRAMHPDPVAGAGPGALRPGGSIPAAIRRARCRATSGSFSATTRPRRPTIPRARRVRRTRRPTSSRASGFAAADRPCGRRADGPGARAVRASCLVVALAPVDPAKGQGVRALAVRLHDEPPHAVAQFARLSAAGRRAGNRDRLPAAERAASSRSAPAGIA